ncbi:universal stress protein [Myxococcota bacterium]|nr:universal stress protein [Myxococcota bacterium]
MVEDQVGPRQVAKKKVLVPFDFTQKAEMALDFALEYSENIEVDIYLFNVIEESVSDFRRLDRLNEENLELMKTSVMKALERVSATGVHTSVDRVHRRMANGKVWKEILKMASGISADIVIMGASESRGARSMLAKFPCTVVFVREKDTAFVA